MRFFLIPGATGQIRMLASHSAFCLFADTQVFILNPFYSQRLASKAVCRNQSQANPRASLEGRIMALE